MPVAQLFADQTCSRNDKQNQPAALPVVKAGIVGDKAQARVNASLAHDDRGGYPSKACVDFARCCAIAATAYVGQLAA